MTLKKLLATATFTILFAANTASADSFIYTGASQKVYSINSGGGGLTNWDADRYFTGGGSSTTTNAISQTPEYAAMYQSQRLGNTTYRVPVPNGDYIVVLYFAETYFNAPLKRVFDVNIQDVNVLNQLDIFNLVGKNVGLEQYFRAKSVTNGELKIEFKNATHDQPSVAGIAIYTSIDAVPIPGLIQAENYKPGVDGVGYHDTTPGNNGGIYRKGDVDLEPTTDAGGGLDVGWITSGEWLAYPVSVTKSDKYKFTFRVASGASGTKTFHLEVDGVNVTGPISFTTNQGWQNFNDVVVDGILLNTQHKDIRLVVDQGGFNINYFKVESSTQSVLIRDLHFQDAAFASCVNTAASTYGWVYAQDVTELNCYAKGIASIVGIDVFPNLTKVVLGHNHLVSVDFKKNPKLTWISLDHNHTISFIDVTTATNLTTLDLWDNSLQTINLNNNPALSWLSIGDNPLTPEAKAYIRSLSQIKDLQIDP